MSVLHITKENFEKEVLNSEKVVLLDFFATWCGPCRMVGPIIDEIAEENGEIVVGKVDVDAQTELATQFQVYSIPTLVVLKDGKVLKQATGAKSKAQILGSPLLRQWASFRDNITVKPPLFGYTKEKRRKGNEKRIRCFGFGWRTRWIYGSHVCSSLRPAYFGSGAFGGRRTDGTDPSGGQLPRL